MERRSRARVERILRPRARGDYAGFYFRCREGTRFIRLRPIRLRSGRRAPLRMTNRAFRHSERWRDAVAPESNESYGPAPAEVKGLISFAAARATDSFDCALLRRAPHP